MFSLSFTINFLLFETVKKRKKYLTRMMSISENDVFHFLYEKGELLNFFIEYNNKSLGII